MKIFQALILVAALAAVPGLSSGQQQAGGPRIAVDEARFHAGKVTQGSRVSHVFEIRNEGSATLVIEKVQPG